MGQATGLKAEQQLDTVITNALIIDYSGIYKADVGIKDGIISGIGKAGNPDTMQNVSANMIVGVNTEAIAGEGLILTAGGMDSHVHFICPQICDEAIASGLTTMLGKYRLKYSEFGCSYNILILFLNVYFNFLYVVCGVILSYVFFYFHIIRWRNRSCQRNLCHHLHSWPVPHEDDAAGH